MLLKVATANNFWFVTIGFVVMGSNFKTLYVMAAMI